MKHPYINNPDNMNRVSIEEMREVMRKVDHQNKALRKTFKTDRISMSFQASPNPYN